MAFPTGTPAPRVLRRSAEWRGASGRSVQRARTGGQLRGGDRLPGAGSLRLLAVRRWRSRRGERRGTLPGCRAVPCSSRLLEEPYLSTSDAHQGLLLHSVYHRPNGWDHVPAGRAVPCGESSMWGDYHLREAALYAQRLHRRRRAAHVLDTKGRAMTIADLSAIEGRTYPAGRRTQNLVGGASPIQANGFCMGYVTLEPGGGQVPWHNHQQEEVYFIVRGTAEACVGQRAQDRRHGPGSVRAAADLSPAHQHRDRADGHALRLLPGR